MLKRLAIEPVYIKVKSFCQSVVYMHLCMISCNILTLSSKSRNMHDAADVESYSDVD